jgi:hypothetical protein
VDNAINAEADGLVELAVISAIATWGDHLPNDISVRCDLDQFVTGRGLPVSLGSLLEDQLLHRQIGNQGGDSPNFCWAGSGSTARTPAFASFSVPSGSAARR